MGARLVVLDGQKLKAARGDKPQYQIAAELEISANTLCRAERGDPVRPKIARTLARHYGIDVLDIIVEVAA